MKKISLLIVLMVLMIGCSKIDKGTNDVHKKEAPLVLKFDGTKLLIENSTEKNIVIFDSKTEFSINSNGKWELADVTQGGLMITSTVLGKETLEMNFEKELSEVQSDNVKVTIYYAYGYESEKSETQSITYNKGGY